MKDNHQNKQDLTSLRIRRHDDGVQIPQQEENRPAKSHTNKGPIERRQRTPTDQRNCNPDNIRISIQRPGLDKIRARATGPP